MKKNLHTSPDMFDKNIINVYNPGSREKLGHIISSGNGFVSENTRNNNIPAKRSGSDALQTLSPFLDQRIKKVRLLKTEWNIRMNLVSRNLRGF